MNEPQAASPAALPQPLGASKDSAGRADAWMLWAIWLSTWFSPLKLNIGLNLSFEFMLAYLLVIYYLLVGRLSIGQVVGILGLGMIAMLDYARAQDPKVFMFLGFALVNVSMVKLVLHPVASAQRWSQLFLLVPMLAVLMRFLMPELGGIDGHDQTTVGVEVVQRFNLLGYESNSLAIMMTMLMGAVLAGVGQLKLIWRLAYSLFCIAVVGATFSRTGIFAVIALLLYFTFFSRSGSRPIILLMLCCILGVGIMLSDLGPILEVIANRASAFNYFEDERGSILIERLKELQQSLSLFLFGRGFMTLGASDNSILALMHGYGYLGAFVAVTCLLLSSGVARGKVRWYPQLAGISIPIFFYLLTADVFGQAKVIGCFYCLMGLHHVLNDKHIRCGSNQGLQ